MSNPPETEGPAAPAPERPAWTGPESPFVLEGQPLRTARDVARFFGVRESLLIYALYKAPEETRYRAFTIPKRTGGVRRIHAPRGQVRTLQTRMAGLLQEVYQPHPSAHGFLKGRSIVSNAAEHVGRRAVLNIDLEDFFPSINFGRVRGLFMAQPFNCGPAAATVLAAICTHENGLPQGAPTSPALSNLIAATLDRRLTRLARDHRLTYTRYADDITFSANQPLFPPDVAEAAAPGEVARPVRPGPALIRAVSAAGFAINQRKVRLQARGQRQLVTGLAVNARVNVARTRIRQIRAMLHAWEKFGLAAAAAEHFARWSAKPRTAVPAAPERAFRNAVYGRLAYVKMVRGAEDPVFLNACARLIQLDPNPSRFIREMAFGGADFDIFINHASEDKEAVALPIFEACERLGLKVFLDRAHIAWGESFAKKINTALGSARTVLAIISASSVAKDWPMEELNRALSFEVEGQKQVLPVIVGRPDLSALPLIRTKDYLVWSGDADLVAQRLVAAVRGAARPKMAPPAVPEIEPEEPPPPPAKRRSWLARFLRRR